MNTSCLALEEVFRKIIYCDDQCRMIKRNTERTRLTHRSLVVFQERLWMTMNKEKVDTAAAADQLRAWLV